MGSSPSLNLSLSMVPMRGCLTGDQRAYEQSVLCRKSSKNYMIMKTFHGSSSCRLLRLVPLNRRWEKAYGLKLQAGSRSIFSFHDRQLTIAVARTVLQLWLRRPLSNIQLLDLMLSIDLDATSLAEAQPAQNRACITNLAIPVPAKPANREQAFTYSGLVAGT
jgi:hypothetical protein